MSHRKTSRSGSSSSLPTISEEKGKKAAARSRAQNKPPLPSIRGIIAARILSHKLKEKSERLAANRRRRGDAGDFTLTHYFSPEDLQDAEQHEKRAVHKEESLLSILTHSNTVGHMEPSRTFPVSIMRGRGIIPRCS